MIVNNFFDTKMLITHDFLQGTFLNLGIRHWVSCCVSQKDSFYLSYRPEAPFDLMLRPYWINGFQIISRKYKLLKTCK